MLKTTICLLTVPLLLRVTLDFLSNWDLWFNWITSSSKSITTYNIAFFLLTTYSTMFTQCGTLVFGLMRQNQIKEYKVTKEKIK